MILTGETCDVSKISQVFGGQTSHDHCGEVLVFCQVYADGSQIEIAIGTGSGGIRGPSPECSVPISIPISIRAWNRKNTGPVTGAPSPPLRCRWNPDMAAGVQDAKRPGCIPTRTCPELVEGAWTREQMLDPDFDASKSKKTEKLFIHIC